MSDSCIHKATLMRYPEAKPREESENGSYDGVMVDKTFKRNDLKHLAIALMNEVTHAEMDLFEMDLDIDTEGTKSDRARSIVQYLHEQQNSDEWIIKLLDFLYVDRLVDSSRSLTFGALQRNVLVPRRVEETDDGFKIQVAPDAPKVSLDVRDDPLSALANLSAPGAPVTGNPEAFPQWVTGAEPAPAKTSREFFVPQPASADFGVAAVQPETQRADTSMTESARDPRGVFLVHGRDKRPVQVLEQFLSYLGLHVVTWSQADALTKMSQPTTFDIVKAGIESAGAVLVIFSPDDLAMVQQDFREDGDETQPVGQARQNVILEAGMAFALSPDRTIFVKSQATREISDIAGFNWINLNGSWESRQALKMRLRQAGAAVRDGEYDLQRPVAGPFKV